MFLAVHVACALESKREGFVPPSIDTNHARILAAHRKTSMLALAITGQTNAAVR